MKAGRLRPERSASRCRVPQIFFLFLNDADDLVVAALGSNRVRLRSVAMWIDTIARIRAVLHQYANHASRSSQ